ncbi:hypothetical protein [Candidatus Cyanaurora vandensis]|uniref:hypothetical protein n=1 Tax=Candidatus Cyanaurora vandensis TaxID=2714958 RepID=UPI00257A1B77|nr:hypothetical protein [Candidatus Cyanaurora vandensis]
MKSATPDHDGNFKKLLTTFFVEFVDLFFPQIRAALVPESVEFLTQEFFLDPLIEFPGRTVRGSGATQPLELARLPQLSRPSRLCIDGEDADCP